MKQSILTFLLLMILASSLLAQDSVFTEDQNYESTEYEQTPHATITPSELDNTKEFSNEKLTIKKFDDTQWKKVTKNADYDNIKAKHKKKNQDNSESSANDGRGDYTEEYEDDTEFGQQSTSFNVPMAGPIMMLIFYGSIIAIIGAILFMIIQNANWKSNPKVDNKPINPEQDDIEDIATLDIDDLLRRSQNAKNYRLALRMNFLGLLKRLNEVGFIIWKKDKTNRDYLNELFARQRFFDEVQLLTLAYEKVWYGDHELPEASYLLLMQEFKAIDLKLNTGRVL